MKTMFCAIFTALSLLTGTTTPGGITKETPDPTPTPQPQDEIDYIEAKEDVIAEIPIAGDLIYLLRDTIEAKEEIPVLVAESGAWRCQHGEARPVSESLEFLESHPAYYYAVTLINLGYEHSDAGQQTLDQAMDWLNQNWAAVTMLAPDDVVWITDTIAKIEADDAVREATHYYSENGINYWNPGNASIPEEPEEGADQPIPPEKPSEEGVNQPPLFDIQHPDLTFNNWGVGFDCQTNIYYYATSSGAVYEITDRNFLPEDAGAYPDWEADVTMHYVGNTNKKR